MYYGQNAVSKNRIVVDRRQLLNGNSFRLGVSGSGKSMSAKEEIAQIALSTEDDILILDVESEFGYLTEALGGEVIRISATSDTHINALDMDRAYGDERNPIVSKSEFVLSLFEQLIGSGLVTAKEKSILGRCTEQVYMPYVRNGYKGAVPTLKDFYRLLKMQPEPFLGTLHHRHPGHIRPAYQRGYQGADYRLRYPGTGRTADAYRNAGDTGCHLQPCDPELEAGTPYLDLL